MKIPLSLIAVLVGSSSLFGQIFYEGFNYTNPSNLGGQGGWVNVNTGDEVVVGGSSLNVSGLQSSVGGSVSFDGIGIDPQKTFTAVTSGSLYFSFAMQVTALGTLDTVTGGYFAGFGANSTTFSTTVWTRASGAGYNIGLQNNTSTNGIQWTSTVYGLNTTVFVAGSFDLDSDSASLWVNPASSSFSSTAPTAMLTAAAGSTRTSLDRFFLRQDSLTETPSFIVDELRVGTSWASVTPSAVPEPGTYAALAGLGVLGLAAVRRRRV